MNDFVRFVGFLALFGAGISTTINLPRPWNLIGFAMLGAWINWLWWLLK